MIIQSCILLLLVLVPSIALDYIYCIDAFNMYLMLSLLLLQLSLHAGRRVPIIIVVIITLLLAQIHYMNTFNSYLILGLFLLQLQFILLVVVHQEQE